MNDSCASWSGSSLSRRSLLALAGAAAAGPVVGGMLAPSAAAAIPRPAGSDYVRYEDLYRSGDSLQKVIEKVTGNRILTLPAGLFIARDFLNGYYSGISIGTGNATGCRGLAGSGRDTIIRVQANTSSRSLSGGSAGSQLAVSNKPSAVLTNFTLKGNPQNGRNYDGIKVATSPDAQLSWLYLQGGSRGYANTPPGEAFGINVLRSDRVTVSDTEVDGRDDFGTRVGSSPIGWNYSRDAAVIRTYAHHGVAGMLTFFDTTNVYTEDYHAFSTSSGSGSKSGHGINHEQSQGIIRHIRPQLFVNGVYSRVAGATGSTGMHLMFANTKQDVPDIEIIDPQFDKGPGSTGMMAVQIADRYSVFPGGQQIKTAPYVRKNGVVLEVSHHPTQGFGDKDPARFYTWVH